MDRVRSTSPVQPTESSDTVVVPVVEEQLEVSLASRESERVRVTKTVATEEVLLDAPFVREDIRVERVRVDQEIESVPPVRTEGETTVIPVVEEIVVFEKRLVLREEVRVTKTRTESTRPMRMQRRRENAHVERIEPDAEHSEHSKRSGT